MTTATITPLRGGTAVMELFGIAAEFPSWEAAAAHARRLGVLPRLLPFPAPSVEVLATSPALRVLP